MSQATKNDIDKAKEYLRRRLSAEVSMEHYLDRKLSEAAKEIVSLACKRSIPPTLFSFSYDPFLTFEVDRIINKITDEIEEYDLLLATKTDREDKSVLLAYANRDINGVSYRQRLENYTLRFKLELQDLIGAGLLLGMAKSKLTNVVLSAYKRPYTNSIASDREHKGQSSYSRLLLLTRHTIADTWMHADMEYHRRLGAIGFIPYRGSSYPCDTCSDHAGRFHDFAEPYPPFHPRCVCYAVPIYQ